MPPNSEGVLESVFLGDERSQPEVFFLHLLFHFYTVVQSNNHSLLELTHVGTSVEKDIVGNALFPTVASILNHSCDPNTSPVVIDQTQVTVATRTIPKGEEINHIYQGHFGDTPLEKRRAVLKKLFYFDCACLACVRDYPLGKHLPRTFADSGSVLKPLEEGEMKDPLELDRIYLDYNAQIEEATAQGDVERILQLYYRRAELVCRHLEPPHFMYLTSRAAITDCLAILYSYRSAKAKGQKLSAIYI